ncbi:mycofactocin biosynthesis chaperone MftB [Streptomyces ochraceiscleroticus]|uniref:Mycofactocin biosynthesis chaperone MftB n=1 Tax=Streptomyces ochraceiscleroticus TaxID=47761 RepID=A0ABW1MJR8_9ACTN|nr:mycofactocin biosynthesis chaperone MftB [Streptomyces ochraceiscleroticus]
MPAPTASFSPDRGYRLNPNVALRPEPFGALAYHFGNRRLSFLKDLALVELVEHLGEHPSAREALATLPAAQHEPTLRALAVLAATDMIVPV